MKISALYLPIIILTAQSIITMESTTSSSNTWKPLATPPKIERFGILAVQASEQLPPLWNSLTPAERIFIYYMYRASLPGNLIVEDQNHRCNTTLRELFTQLIQNKETITAQTFPFDIQQFIEQATIYYAFLWANHGHYFLKEFETNKYSPQKLDLDLITPEHIEIVLKAVNNQEALNLFNTLEKTVFDTAVEPTRTVDGSIEKSAINIYAPGFTQADYDSLPHNEQAHLNRYFYKDEQGNAKSMPYAIGAKYDKELETTIHWLKKAQEVAQNNPAHFDEHIVTSLELLMKFFATGDEQYFREHSKEWLKTNSRLDYTTGFIEVYEDPKAVRGEYASEVTIKSLNMEELNKVLPGCEAKLPFPAEYKRKGLDDGTATLPNASINVIAFGSGGYGPLLFTAAYCLPNYNDIRSECGSKQIIYKEEASLALLLQPKLYKQLSYLQDHRTWHEENDPNFALNKDIWTLQVILHETLGHGSGALAQGIDETAVNNNLGKYFSAHEELRAEIIALLTSIDNYDQFASMGLLHEWPKKLSKSELINKLIENMAATGLRRLIAQPDSATTINGAHSQANYTIMNYLIDNKGLELIQEPRIIGEDTFTVLGVKVSNQKQALKSINELAVLVQTIKSTANKKNVHDLFEAYGTKIRNPNHITWAKACNKKVMDGIKGIVRLFPEYQPIQNKSGSITDIQASWPKGFIEQALKHTQLGLSIK